jgi:hypothetical protein
MVEKKRRRRFPWMYMEPGDSFFESCEEGEYQALNIIIHASFRHFKKSQGVKGKIVVRSVAGGCRAWLKNLAGKPRDKVFIDKNIPIANKERLGNDTMSRYPWGVIKVGESFYVDSHEQDIEDLRTRLFRLSKAYYSRRGMDVKISTKSLGSCLQVKRIR